MDAPKKEQMHPHHERITTVPGIWGARWLLLDGLAYSRTEGKMQGHFVYDPSQLKSAWMKPKDNTYNVYDGMIAVVFSGKTYIAPHSEKREEAVVRGSFRKDFFPLPSLSSYERLEDEELTRLLESLRM